MKRFLDSLRILVVTLILMLGVAPTFVSASFSNYIDIRVFNNSSNVYTELPVLVTINNSQLIALGYINGTALNTNLLEGASNQRYMVALSRLGIYSPGFAGGQVRTYQYRLNETNGQSSFPVIVGHLGNFTVVDSSSIELFSNYTITAYGYFQTDAGTNKNVIRKTGAIALGSNSTVNGVIESGVSYNSTTVGQYLVPDGSGDFTGIATAFPVVAHYLNVDDPPGFPDGSATYVSTTNTVQERDAYNVQNMTALTFVEPTVRVFFNITRGGAADTIFARPGFRLNGVEINGTIVSTAVADPTYVAFSETIGRPGGGTWSLSDINNLQVTVALNSTAGSQARLTQINVGVFENTSALSNRVVATGVSSGLHTAVVAQNTTTLSLAIDGTQRDQVSSVGVGIIDNTNNWFFMENDSLIYLITLEIRVNGVQKLYFAPTQIVDPTNVSDLSGNGNTGTINFGTNPTPIEVTIGGLASYIDYVASSASTSNPPEIFHIPDPPLDIYEDPAATGSNLPQYALVNAAAVALGFTTPTFYGMLMFFVSICMSFAGAVATGSLLMGVIFGIILLGAAAGTGIIPALFPVALGVVILLIFVVRKS